MKRVRTKQMIPLFMAGFAVVFGWVGVFKLGFWKPDQGPAPGFFPSIMAVVMFLTSILAFIQSFKEDGTVKYEKQELLVIASGAGIIFATLLIGLVGSCFLYIILWLKVFEKASWKDTLIILAVVAFIVIGVFGLWLGIQFPLGLMEYIL